MSNYSHNIISIFNESQIILIKKKEILRSLTLKTISHFISTSFPLQQIFPKYRNFIFRLSLPLSLSIFNPSEIRIAQILSGLCVYSSNHWITEGSGFSTIGQNRGYLQSEIDRFELCICAGPSHFHIQVPTSVTP